MKLSFSKMKPINFTALLMFLALVSVVLFQNFYKPPTAILSYVPRVIYNVGGKTERLTGPFNFMWDSKLIFSATNATCLDTNGNQLQGTTCNVLMAYGSHPENVPAPDYINMNDRSLNIDSIVTAGSGVMVLQGALQTPNGSGGDCGAASDFYMTGPGDSFGTFTVIPQTPTDFLPTPVAYDPKFGSSCSQSDPLVQYNVYVYVDMNFSAYSGDPKNDPPRCPNNTTGIQRQPASVVVDTVTGNPCYTGAVGLASTWTPDLLLNPGQKQNTFDSIESSISADGHFLIMNAGGGIEYSFNPTPEYSNTWTPPGSIVNAYTDLKSQTVVINGVTRPATDVAPIAFAPMRKADGTLFAYNEPFAGAYPWISNDASEAFYEAVRITQNGNGGKIARGVTRAGFSGIGRMTNFIERHFDDWTNRDQGNISTGHVGSERVNPRSPGSVPGLWNNWRSTGFGIPLSKIKKPMFPMFVQGANSDYSEISFDSVEDGSDIFYLEMNELVVPDSDYKKEYVPGMTADISGNANNGAFGGGAQIPETIAFAGRTFAQSGQTQQPYQPYFVSAKAAQFPAAGNLTVAINPNSTSTLRDFTQGLSLEFFLRQDAGVANLPGNIPIANLSGVFSVALNSNKVTMTLLCHSPQTIGIDTTSHGASSSDWVHIAFTYKPLTGNVTAYLDGNPVSTVNCNGLSSKMGNFTDPFVAGPNVTGNGDSTVVYWLDQLRLSRVERSAVQIAEDAKVYVQITPINPLPKGLNVSDLQIPLASVYDPYDLQKAQLGQAIFNDTSLSSNKSVSCATCHSVTTAFADSRGISVGVTGLQLPRSAPSIFNRAFGGAEMWDGAHSSLESQASAPFLNPNEMGMTADSLNQAVTAKYGKLFRSYYQSPVTQDLIADAVAKFVRTLVSGDAPIDEYLGGKLNAMTANQIAGYDLFRGKARCIACHSGSNFTDELYHRHGFSQLELPADLGRAAIACAANDTNCLNRTQFMYKTPSLRNIALTAPYFHNYSRPNLNGVVALYNAGPNDSVDQPHDPLMRPLGLTSDEQNQLIDFLKHGLTSAKTQGNPPPQ